MAHYMPKIKTDIPFISFYSSKFRKPKSNWKICILLKRKLYKSYDHLNTLKTWQFFRGHHKMMNISCT